MCADALSLPSSRRYALYNAFVSELLDSAQGAVIPHCDSRILHRANECDYCRDSPELQGFRDYLGIAFTGHDPLPGEVPCEADAMRPPGADNDHRRWGGNKPTSAKGDLSWPEETFASRVMYGDPESR